ncbi:TRAP transporter small permease [Salibacterium aidingense]|uniref:TRAP transporter small permease n=1 Tax=Salibacterium aidingense TaxID=384933 RepID=UPI0003F81ABB|nr:TRAP transporter small permease [Salibacterium aidingense]
MGDKIINFIYNRLLANVVILIGFVMVLNILFQIFARTFLTQSFPWTEEFARLSFIWFCLLGSVITLTRRMHLGVEYFYRMLKCLSKIIIDCVIHVIVLFFGAVLCYYGVLLVLNAMDQISPILRIPMAYFYMPMPLTGGFFFLYTLHQLWSLFRKNHSEEHRV